MLIHSRCFFEPAGKAQEAAIGYILSQDMVKSPFIFEVCIKRILGQGNEPLIADVNTFYLHKFWPPEQNSILDWNRTYRQEYPFSASITVASCETVNCQELLGSSDVPTPTPGQHLVVPMHPNLRGRNDSLMGLLFCHDIRLMHTQKKKVDNSRPLTPIHR